MESNALLNPEIYRNRPDLARQHGFLFISSSSKKFEPLENAIEGCYENQNKAIFENAGFEIDVTTLTQIKSKVREQKFFEVPIADYVPVVVGEGAWMEELISWKSRIVSDDFEAGFIDSAQVHSKLSEVNAEIEEVRQNIQKWAKSCSYSLPELRQSTITGNWNKVEEIEKARKKNWDLGIQKTAFLGRSSIGFQGLVNLSDVVIDTTTITKSLPSMTDTEFQTFVSEVVGKYRANARFTAFPDRFLIPDTEYTGLVRSDSTGYMNKTRLQFLEEAFQIATMNANFKVLPLAYLEDTYNELTETVRYILYKNDADVLDMNIPIDYTSTAFASINGGFHMQNVAYGQFTGVQLYRPREILYFDRSTAE